MRWALLVFVALLALGVGAVLVARFFGHSGSRASILVSVISHWLAAYVLWTFAAGLGHHYGLLAAYDAYVFAVLAVVVGFWHYRTSVTRGRPQGRIVFIGGQLAWLVIVLLQNGVFRP